MSGWPTPRVWSVHKGQIVAFARLGAVNIRRLISILFAPYSWRAEAAPELGACRPREENVQMPLHRPNYVHCKPAKP